MEPAWLQPQYIAPFAIALGLVVFLFARARSKKKLMKLAGALDERSGEVTGVLHASLSGHFHGYKASFEIVPGGKNRPPRLFVGLGCSGTLHLEILRKNVITRLVKNVGAMETAEMGDAELDSRFIFSSKDPVRLRSWMSGEDVRHALKALLLSRKVDGLSVKDSMLRASRIRPSRADYDPEQMRQILEEMEVLIRTL